jgi:hypothetical protein
MRLAASFAVLSFRSHYQRQSKYNAKVAAAAPDRRADVNVSGSWRLGAA